MPRQPKPWYRPSRGLWYVQINGRQHNLGQDREAAWRQFHLLMASPEPTVAPDLLAVLFDKFLEWTQKNRAPRTYDWYQERLQEFLTFRTNEYTIAQVSTADLKPYHVQDWIDSKNCSNGHRRGCVTAVKRAVNWAFKLGRIDRNPIAGLEKPQGGRRDVVISETIYEQIRGRASDQNFYDLVTLAWETGARPEELLAVKAHHVDLTNARWVFPRDEAKGKRRQRVIYLSDEAFSITRRLLVEYASDNILRNANDKPWSRSNVSNRFGRLKKHIGIHLCLYNFRHTFATRMVEAGLDSLVVSALLGHADLSMLGKTYAHLTQNPEYLRQQLKKVKEA